MTELTPEQQAELDRDAEQKRYEYFRTLGLDEKHAELLSASTAKDFTWNGVRLIYNATGKAAVEDGAAAEHYKAEYPLLFPEPVVPKGDDVVPPVNPDLVAAALGGSMTARGQVFTALKLDPKDANAIAQLDAFLDTARLKQPAAGTNTDDANDLKAARGPNPFKKGPGFNLTRQMTIYKSDPALAARLARAAGVTL